MIKGVQLVKILKTINNSITCHSAYQKRICCTSCKSERIQINNTYLGIVTVDTQNWTADHFANVTTVVT